MAETALSDTAPAEAQRIPGFKVADTIYTFPAHVPPGNALTFLRLLHGSDPFHAMTWGLMTLLGAEQYRRLEQDPAVTREDMTAVGAAARTALLEPLEGAHG